MKRIVYTRPDGGTAVVIPCVSVNDPAEFTEQQALERALKTAVPKEAINVRVVDVTEIPVDRYFRNAWKNDLTVDMIKAREIHRNVLRHLREPKFKQLDIEFMSALEKKQDTALIVQKKQALRDVTHDPRIDVAQTPEELKNIIPSALQS